jgi:two-component system, NarL family, response regulator YdfI
MLAPIRVSIVAEKDEDFRKLSRVFEQFPGFAVVNAFATARLEPRTFDVRVVQGGNLAKLAVLAQARVPTVYLVPCGSVRSNELHAPNAVLPPDAPPTQITAAAMAVAAGLQITHKHYFDVAGNESELSLVEPLTDRELHILNLVADGLSNPQIARRLAISRNTVKFHVSSIISKLQATSRTEAVTIGVKRGLIIV